MLWISSFVTEPIVIEHLLLVGFFSFGKLFVALLLVSSIDYIDLSPGIVVVSYTFSCISYFCPWATGFCFLASSILPLFFFLVAKDLELFSPPAQIHLC